MTTLTTRPLPLLPLAIPPILTANSVVEPLCIDRLSSPHTTSPTSIGSPTVSLTSTPNSSIVLLSPQINHNHQDPIISQTTISEEIMHPDNFLLQGHGVTSPRLSSANSSNSSNIMDKNNHHIGMYNNNNNNNNNYNKNKGNNNNNNNNINNNLNNCDLSVRPMLGAFSSVDSQKNSLGNSIKNLEQSSDNDSKTNLYDQKKSICENNNGRRTDDLMDDDGDAADSDRMSCCSEDSELSVGQEGCDNDRNNSERNNNNNVNNRNSTRKNLNSNRKFFEENSDLVLSNKNKINSSRQQIMMLDDCESVDNISSVSDVDNNRGGPVSVVSENLASDDMSNGSSTPNTNRDDIIVDPTIMMATAAAAAAAVNGLRIPVPIVRPSPTRMQEEFLRKSHLYAEELMKQQMQFMAAARASAFSLRHGGVINPQDIGKIGFRPHVKHMANTTVSGGGSNNNSTNIINQQQQSTNSMVNENITNFSGIHSHLNAISKISSQLGSESALSKLTAFGMAAAREHSQSPRSASPQNHNNHHNNLNPNHHLHQLHPHLPFLNNNFHEPSLKFSIDNILKADFGRRITDPLLKRSGHGGLNSRKNSSKAERQQKNVTPIDLTNVVTHSANTNINSGLSSVSSNCSSDSGSTINVFEKNHRVTPVKSPPSSAATAPCSTTLNTSAQSPSAGASAAASSSASSTTTTTSESSSSSSSGPMVWPAWVYCTRYSDRPSSGPRTKKPKKPPSEKGSTSSTEDKRPRTAFSGPQLARLKHEFAENRYLTEKRRQQLSNELGLNEAQIKIWFQNKRAKIKKSSGSKNPLALQLMAQGLYNHSTVPLTREEEELQELQAQNAAA